MTVLLQVLTLFLLMLCGLGAARFRLVDDQGIKGLNTVVLNFAQPALILTSLQRDASPELLMDLMWVFVLAFVIMTVGGLTAHRLFRREPPSRRAVLSSLCMISNCGYMGYPVIIAAYGEDALIYAAMYVIAFNLISWTLGSFFFGGVRAINVRRLLSNPSILAVAAGMVLFLTGWRLPGFVNGALDMLSGVTTPLAMFVIGARLLTLRPQHLGDRSLLTVCGLRLLVLPALVLLLRLTPLSDMAANTLFLCTAMPCAALTAMQTELYRCDTGLASRGVALSTALSMLTIPVMLLL